MFLQRRVQHAADSRPGDELAHAAAVHAARRRVRHHRRLERTLHLRQQVPRAALREPRGRELLPQAPAGSTIG